MPLKDLDTSETHLALVTGMACAECGNAASRLVRCPKCRKILARCGSLSCGNDMGAIQKTHCPETP